MFKILLLCLIILTGCNSTNNKLEELGYNDDDIKLINKYDIENIVSEYPYREDLYLLLNDPSFEVTQIKEYLELRELDYLDCLMVVNKDYYNDKYSEEILSLMKEKYYLHSRLDRYLYLVDKGYSYRDAIEIVNANRDYDDYSNTIEADLSADILMIANKYYTLGEYEPSDLVQIDSQYGIDGYLREVAYNAYVKMADAAKESGLSLWITSPYRSYDKQKRTYNSYLENDSQEVVDTYSARPGFSDHQTGLTVDIVTNGYGFDNFEDSPEFEWLKNNAHFYGFILRYPEDKTEITGYTYESWHYRYVGNDAANYIYNNHITFDEYYAYFIEGE